MEIKFKSAKIIQDGGWWLCLRVENIAQARSFIDNLTDKLYIAMLKIFRERRSLDANAYAWLLIGKLAEALTAEAQGDTAYSKDDVYLLMLKKYGQGGIVKIRNKDKDNILREVKYWEEHEQFYADNAAYYRIWVGSSNYDTKEMSLFLNGIVADCKELGIETATPEELERYKEKWHG